MDLCVSSVALQLGQGYARTVPPVLYPLDQAARATGIGMRRQTQRSTAAHATAALAASYHKGRRRSPRLLAVAPAASGEQTRSVAVAAAAASPPRVRARGRPRKVSKPTATTADAVEIDAVASATETEQEVRFPHGTLPRTFEKEKEAAGFRCVVGVDEAGRGPLAGPVVAAACFVPVDVEIVGVHDSKKLSEPQREALYAQLTTHPRVRFAVHVRLTLVSGLLGFRLVVLI